MGEGPSTVTVWLSRGFTVCLPCLLLLQEKTKVSTSLSVSPLFNARRRCYSLPFPPKISKVIFASSNVNGAFFADDVVTTSTTTSSESSSSPEAVPSGDAATATADASPTSSGGSPSVAKRLLDAGAGNKNKRGVLGNFEELHGNYILRPSLDGGPPRALIHFLGGAMVGASPHYSYRYLLERLANKGYLVVATPYDLSFDHLKTCDAVIERFERIAALLAQTYGALPVVGIGHSCGALLQLLITSLFPDTPRAANALISFNNKPVSEAVPFFEEAVAPFFTYVAARNSTTTTNGGGLGDNNILSQRPSGSDVISVGLELMKSTAVGEIPPDDLLSKALKLVVPKSLQGTTDFFANPNAAARRNDDDNNNNNDASTEAGVVRIPDPIRTAYAAAASPSASALAKSGVTPVVLEALDVLQQVPLLIDEVADGARDFVPPPQQVRAAVRRSYRARRTLVLKYSDDPIDESDDLEELLKAATQVIAMKRPMIEIDVQRRDLPGGHASPLLAPSVEIAKRAETILGEETARERFLYSQADATVEELVKWLDESNL